MSMPAARRTRMLVWKNRRVVKIGSPTKRVSPRADRDQKRRAGHFRYGEFGKMQLPPEQFGRMQHRRDEIDAVRLHRAVDDRPGARIGGDADAELKIHEMLFRGMRRQAIPLIPAHSGNPVTGSPLARGRAERRAQYRYGSMFPQREMPRTHAAHWPALRRANRTDRACRSS